MLWGCRAVSVSMWLSEQEVAKSETGNRKLLARMTYLYILAVEYIKRTTTWRAPGTVCVCVRKEEEESMRDRGLRPDWTVLKPKNHNTRCVCVFNAKLNFGVTVASTAVSQSVDTTQHFLKTSQLSGKIKGNAGNTCIIDRMVVC